MEENGIESNTPEAAELTNELAEIDYATSDAADSIHPFDDKKKDETPSETSSASQPSETSQPPERTEQAKDFSAEQALFDRAIRAGLSSKDVLSIESRDMVERMVEMAEKANGISPKQDQPEGAAGTPDADSVDAVIEAMKKDGGYDRNLMKLLNGLVTENRNNRTSRKSDERESFFDKQLGSLDAGITRNVDAMHRSQLKAKFDLLKAGYKAQGSHIRDEDVFQEAARLALGDLIANAREERKASALERRRNLTLARPGGESGRRGGATADDDPFADFVAAMG